MEGNRIRIGVIACEILKMEIEKLITDDPDIVHREYLEFALHVYPLEMREIVIEKVNSLEGKVDAVFLGYGTCQSLAEVPNVVNVPTVMLSVDDCIAALLTPVEYAKEKGKCTGTWFASPGWAEKGMEGIIKELKLDLLKDQGYDPMHFAKMIFDGYSRALFIDSGVGDRERIELMSRDFASQLGLTHECRSCTLKLLSEALERTKALAVRLQSDLSQ